MYIEQYRPRGIAVPSPFEAEALLRRNLNLAMTLTGVLVFGLGGMAATVQMNSAIIAPGEVTVASQVKRIGHPTGGIIADVAVRDGDRVRKGQMLLRLNDVESRASLTIASDNVNQLLAREARLIAESEGRSTVDFPPELTRDAASPDVAALMREERRVFALRRDARRGQAAELVQRVRQIDAEISGYGAQQQSLRDQSRLIDQELGASRELWAKRFTTLQRLNQLERAAAELRGSSANALTSAARARAQILEVRQQTIALDQDARSQAATELREVRANLSEIRQRKVAAADADERNTIRAPAAGVVNKLAYTTIGGVIPAGATILEIVPDGEPLIVNLHILPTDVDQVNRRSVVSLRFSAFNSRMTPEIAGTVDTVSADRITDDRTGAAYYLATVSIRPDQLQRLGNLRLKPGMPVEAFVRTGTRTMLSHIVKPLLDQLERAFRAN